MKTTRPEPNAVQGDVPWFPRLRVEVGNLDAGVAFYSILLGVQGSIRAGSRCYFQCGPLTLSVLYRHPQYHLAFVDATLH